MDGRLRAPSSSVTDSVPQEKGRFWKECTDETAMLRVLYDYATRLERRVQPGER